MYALRLSGLAHSMSFICRPRPDEFGLNVNCDCAAVVDGEKVAPEPEPEPVTCWWSALKYAKGA